MKTFHLPVKSVLQQDRTFLRLGQHLQLKVKGNFRDFSARTIFSQLHQWFQLIVCPGLEPEHKCFNHFFWCPLTGAGINGIHGLTEILPGVRRRWVRDAIRRDAGISPIDAVQPVTSPRFSYNKGGGGSETFVRNIKVRERWCHWLNTEKSMT